MKCHNPFPPIPPMKVFHLYINLADAMSPMKYYTTYIHTTCI